VFSTDQTNIAYLAQTDAERALFEDRNGTLRELLVEPTLGKALDEKLKAMYAYAYVVSLRTNSLPF
jgi:hypothetical protein